jgi:predicted metalloprotease
MGRASGLGIGTILILGLIGWALGIDPHLLIGGAEILSGTGETRQEQPAPSDAQAESSDQMREFVSAVLGSTEVQWKEIFAQAGKNYSVPTLVMFSGATRSGCGVAQSAMGPFYCPNDQKVYLDTAFFQDLSGAFEAATSAARAVNSRRPT